MVDWVEDRGMTLAELLVATSMLLIALVLFGSALYVTQRSAQQTALYSSANDAVHVALQDIDRQLRSGYVVSTKAVAPAKDGWALRIYTESSGSPRCVAWAIAPAPTPSTSLALYTVAWPGALSSASVLPSSVGEAPWRLVTDGLTNQKVDTFGRVPKVSETLTRAFWMEDPSGLDVMNSLSIRLWLLSSPREGAGELKVSEVLSSFTSRNQPRSLDTVAGTAPAISKGGACA